jgi:serine/threonine-protein kinase
MRWDQALQVSRQVLASLAEAHCAGIIHRDIKPANLFLCAGPEWPVVRVLDFGIAAATEGDRAARKLTLTGTVLGSAAYMSPEQAQGHEAGPAADLYALGVVLFELLTRRTPFDGRTFTAQLLAKVMERAPGLREVRPELDIPDGVQALVAQLLERDARARPPSARAVAERMTALLEGASLPPLVRAVDCAPAAAQPLGFPRTEPMLLPRTLDNWWAPKTVQLHQARPVMRAALGRRTLAASALLVSVGVLGLGLSQHPGSGGNPSTLGTGSGSRPSPANGPPLLGAGVEVRAQDVLASAADTALENDAAPSASEGDAPVPASTRQGSPPLRKAPKASVSARQRAAHPPAAATALVGQVAGLLARASARQDGLPGAKTAPPRVPEPISPENEGAAVPPWPAQLPDGAAVSPVTPSPEAMQLPGAANAAEPGAQPRAPRYLGTVESAMAAEKSGEISPTQRNDIIAPLRERRQFARSRAIREFREGLIDHAELRARLREIDLEFEGTHGWSE